MIFSCFFEHFAVQSVKFIHSPLVFDPSGCWGLLLLAEPDGRPPHIHREVIMFLSRQLFEPWFGWVYSTSWPFWCQDLTSLHFPVAAVCERLTLLLTRLPYYKCLEPWIYWSAKYEQRSQELKILYCRMSGTKANIVLRCAGP